MWQLWIKYHRTDKWEMSEFYHSREAAQEAWNDELRNNYIEVKDYKIVRVET